MPSKKKTKKSAKKARPKVKARKKALPRFGFDTVTDRRKERRLHPRLPICARVRWGQGQSDSDEERYFFTRDISASGVFLLTDHPPPVGEHLRMEVSIQYVPQALDLRGEVVRHESDRMGRAVGCGVKFSETNPRLLDLFAKMVD